MSNVLDIKPPRERMRLPLNLESAIIRLFFTLLSGTLCIAGLVFGALSLFSHLKQGKWPSAEEWFVYIVCLPLVTLAFYFSIKYFLILVFSDRVQVVAVEITKQNTHRLRTDYCFRGAAVDAGVSTSLAFSLGLSKSETGHI